MGISILCEVEILYVKSFKRTVKILAARNLPEVIQNNEAISVRANPEATCCCCSTLSRTMLPTEHLHEHDKEYRWDH